MVYFKILSADGTVKSVEALADPRLRLLADPQRHSYPVRQTGRAGRHVRRREHNLSASGEAAKRR